MLGQLWVRGSRRNRSMRQALANAIEALEERRLLSGSIELFDATPALFIENQGQWADESIRYAYSGRGANIAMTDSGVAFQLFHTTEQEQQAMTQFSAQFVGANAVVPSGQQEAASRFNYFLGEQDRWRSEVPGYAAVVYEGLYDGIDLHVMAERAFLKYEFHVAAGVNWSPIAMRYDGEGVLSLAGNGDLLLTTPAGVLVDKAPLIWQEIDGRRVEVAGEYVLLDAQTYAFRLTGEVDGRYGVVIDPELAWSTYMGGAEFDWGFHVGVDSTGAVYATGGTTSRGWVTGGFDTSHNGGNDIFVVKLSSSGGHIWSTYLGGSQADFGRSIALDGAGAIYVTGYTTSSNWCSGGFDTSYGGGYGDAFVARLSSSGGHVWSTYLGGSGDETGYSIALDGSGGVYVTGETETSGWISGGFDTIYGGNGDAFVAKLTSSGSHVWSTYIGGSQNDAGTGIVVNSMGELYVTGYTETSGWVSGGFDITYGGNGDAFVVKLTSGGDHVWSTYIGGSQDDSGYSIASDGLSGVYVTGITRSSGWTSGGFKTSVGGMADAFVVKLDSNGNHTWSTYLGGTGNDCGYGIVAGSSGAVYVTGSTGSSGWVSGGFDTSYKGGLNDVFVAKLDSNGHHIWSTYLGGPNDDIGRGIALDDLGRICLVGDTYSTGWASGGFDTSHGGNGTNDAFVARINDPDLVAPAPADGFTAQAGDAQVQLTWTNPADADFAGVLIIQRINEAPTGRPGNGITYAVGQPLGGGIIVYLGNATSFTSTGVIGGSTYHYALHSFDHSRNYSLEVAASATPSPPPDLIPPGPVTGLQAVSGDGQAQVIWSNPADADFAGVIIIRRAALPPNTEPIAGTIYSVGQAIGGGTVVFTGNATGFFDIDLANSTIYHYAVYAYDGQRNYSSARNASVTPVDLTPPANTGDHTEQLGNRQISMTWTNPTDADLAGVLIVRRAGQDPFAAPIAGTAYALGQSLGSGIVVYAGAASSFSDTRLTIGTTYCYAFFAYDHGRNYSTGVSVSASVPADLTLDPVTNLTTQAGVGQVQLMWNNPADADFASVLVVRCIEQLPATSPVHGTLYPVGQAFGSGAIIYAGSATSFIDIGLSSDVTYRYIVYARDHASNYSAGTVAEGAPLAPPDVTPPGQITGLMALAGDRHVQLTWTNPADPDFTGVLVIRREGQAPAAGPVAGVTYALGQSLGGGTIVYLDSADAFSDTNLTNGATYHYALYAFDDARNYASAVNLSAKPAIPPDLTPPAPVAALTASAGNGQAQLNWTNPADPDFAGVLIIRRTGLPPAAQPATGTTYTVGQFLGGGTIVYIGSAASFSNTALLNGTTYHYALHTFDAARNYSAAAGVSATPTAPPIVPAISINGVSVSEGHSGNTTATFTVRLSAATTQTVTVQYTTADGSAIAGSDYLAASGTLTFAPGQTSQSIQIAILGDWEVEADEVFLVRLLSPANATLAVSEATGVILNDDQPFIPADPHDTTPPAAVAQVEATATDGQVLLSWPDPTDGDLAGILIIRRPALPPTGGPGNGSSYSAGQLLGEGVILYSGSATSFLDTTAMAGLTWHYAIYAYDAALNYSAPASTSATVPISLPQDQIPPTAKLAKPPAVKPGKLPYRFKVAYTDTASVSAASLGHRNVLVTGPKKYKQWARLVVRTPAGDAARIVATYQIIAPGKTWGSEDNGLYTIWLSANQVRDVHGNAAPKLKLGQVKVALRTTSAARAFSAARIVQAETLPASMSARLPMTAERLFSDRVLLLGEVDRLFA